MTQILVLASASPRRKELLGLAGLEHVIRVPDVDETPRKNETPVPMVKRLSALKAATIASALEKDLTGFVIAADTTVLTQKKEILGKPANFNEAVKMIQSLQGRKHHVFTAYTLLKVVNGKVLNKITRSVRTDVYMKKLSLEEIHDYINRGESMDKAGAYAAQGFGMVLIEKISGSYTNVVGLPVAEVMQDLKKLGYGRTSRRKK